MSNNAAMEKRKTSPNIRLVAALENAAVKVKSMSRGDVLPVYAALHSPKGNRRGLEFQWVEEGTTIRGFRLTKAGKLIAEVDHCFVWTDEDKKWYGKVGLHNEWVTIYPGIAIPSSIPADEIVKWRIITLPVEDFTAMQLSLIKADGSETSKIPLEIPVAE